MKVLELLSESIDYLSMFNALLRRRPSVGDLLIPLEIRELILRQVSWAKANLKRNDRIVWYLRWTRIYISYGINQKLGELELQNYNRKLHTNYSIHNIIFSTNPIRELERIGQQLRHFLSLPDQNIQNQVFGSETPQDLLGILRRFEQAWQKRIEEEKSYIQPEEEDTVLLEFPDGYAWWLLPRAGCSKEAAAMGHCGNVPSQREGQQILSLRRKALKGKEVYWYPVATFIIDEDGYLGEMKGRNNDKPIKKYHPYIIELLKHNMIKGIRGGGYFQHIIFP